MSAFFRDYGPKFLALLVAFFLGIIFHQAVDGSDHVKINKLTEKVSVLENNRNELQKEVQMVRAQYRLCSDLKVLMIRSFLMKYDPLLAEACAAEERNRANSARPMRNEDYDKYAPQ